MDPRRGVSLSLSLTRPPCLQAHQHWVVVMDKLFGLMYDEQKFNTSANTCNKEWWPNILAVAHHMSTMPHPHHITSILLFILDNKLRVGKSHILKGQDFNCHHQDPTQVFPLPPPPEKSMHYTSFAFHSWIASTTSLLQHMLLCIPSGGKCTCLYIHN